jgi:hypothetical protein
MTKANTTSADKTESARCPKAYAERAVLMMIAPPKTRAIGSVRALMPDILYLTIPLSSGLFEKHINDEHDDYEATKIKKWLKFVTTDFELWSLT